MARGDLGERQALDAELAIAIGEPGHCFGSLPSPGAGLSGAGGGSAGLSDIVVVGVAPGGRPVGAGADLPGGSFKGPLIPHPGSASSESPHLVPGFGASVWTANVALVQSTQSTLDHLYQINSDRNTGMIGDPALLREPGLASSAVDLDFLQALNNSAVNL